jgi:hypothetical protein
MATAPSSPPRRRLRQPRLQPTPPRGATYLPCPLRQVNCPERPSTTASSPFPARRSPLFFVVSYTDGPPPPSLAAPSASW